MLAALSPESLARMRFPLGEYEKPQVREIAAEAGLPVAEQGGLPGPLLPGRHHARALPAAPRRQRATCRVVSSTRTGSVLGEHDGHELFTVGQRRGLGVYASEPLFVLDKDADDQPGRGRPARAPAHQPRAGARRAPPSRGRPGRSRQAPLSLEAAAGTDLRLAAAPAATAS